MPDNSPRLELPFIQPSQAQKHVTHNEALLKLDTMVQLSVEGFEAITPPSLPQDGEVHALGTGATGAWAGQDGMIATFNENTWNFIAPQEGWQAWGKAEGKQHIYAGGDWSVPATDLQNIDGVGINTTSDATNRLSISSDATLLSHDGTDHQLKINKAAGGDTASLMFQTGWSGRAEMGTTGDDDFHIKVSADGSSFQDALTMRADTGTTDVKCLHSGKITIASDSVGLIDTPSAGGFVLIMVVHDSFPQTAHSAILAYDTGTSPALATMVMGSSFENQGTTTLTGTTSTANYTGIAAQAGQLKIENRLASSRTYSYTFIGGL